MPPEPPDQNTESIHSDDDPIEVAHRYQHGEGDAAAMPAWISIEGYEILRELHRGGQGVVYQAIQKSTKSKVAIKVLLEKQHSTHLEKIRFQREIELVAQLRHPNIISIHDAGETSDGRSYYVMDYIAGTSLGDYVHAHMLPLERMLELFQTVCGAVNAAHQKGIIHRDLKPSNILVDAEGMVKVLDFGLARSLAAPIETVVSMTGDFFGTLPYMSPEQTRGVPEEIDVHTDVYSLGVVLYELLTGRYPYPLGGQISDMIQHIRETAPTPLKRAWISGEGIASRSGARHDGSKCPIDDDDDDLETIVLVSLAKEKERRYANAGDLCRDIGHYLHDEPIEARRDSAAYVLRKNCRMLAQKHRLACLLGAVIAATVVARALGVPLVYHWTSANARFEPWMRQNLTPAATGSALERVRIIGRTDDTDMKALARTQGVEIDTANLQSLRRLHGLLMKRLATSGCRTLIWDFTFKGETPFDDDFVRGVQAMRNAGIDVVVTVWPWWSGDRGLPELSTTIAPLVRWGCDAAGFREDAPWELPLVAQRGMTDPLASLALAGLASNRRPGKKVDLLLYAQPPGVDLLFLESGTGNPQAKGWLDHADHIDLSHIAPITADDTWAPEFGLQAGDTVGYYPVEMPPDTVLAASTVPYEDIFSASDTELRDWFRGRAVMLGDLRTSAKDRFGHPDGRNILGCYGHAVALDDLLRKVHARMPMTLEVSLLPLAAALLVCLAVSPPPWSMGLRFLPMAVLTAALILGSLAAFKYSQYLFNPLIAVFAVLVAGELCAVVNRAYHRRHL